MKHLSGIPFALFFLALTLCACGEGGNSLQSAAASICTGAASGASFTIESAQGYSLSGVQVHLYQSGDLHHLTDMTFDAQTANGSSVVEVNAPMLIEGPFELYVRIPGHSQEHFKRNFSAGCDGDDELRFELEQ